MMRAYSASRISRFAGTLALALTAGFVGGCYDEHAPPPQQQPPAQPAPVEQPRTGGSATNVGDQSGSALGGARRAAHNTVESVEQQQEELEKAIEDN